MGPAGLTAVFGMGTGVAPPVWSPGRRPAGGQAAPGAVIAVARSRRAEDEAESVGERGATCVSDLHGAWTPHDRSPGRVTAFVTRVETVSVIHRRSPGPPSAGGRRVGVVKPSAVRTGRLRRSPAVHSQPIDLVVFQEPSSVKRARKPRLGGGFALRCLQRLSGPDLATRRCPERDSRHTRGRSSPILSY